MNEASVHLCNETYRHLPSMTELFAELRVLPTSTNGDILCVRSHIAYWSGTTLAERMTIKPSRGHSLKVTAPNKQSWIVRVTNWRDHRKGVIGYLAE